MGLLAQLWREKKSSTHFGSLLMSCESIMNLTKENTKFYELINAYCVQWLFSGWKIIFIEFATETWEVRIVLTQK